METIYARKDYLEKQQTALIRKMEYIHSQCEELNIVCCEDDGKWGIWLMVGEEMVLIDPLSLVNSLFIDSNFYMFFSYGGKEYRDSEVNVCREAFCISWSIDSPDFPLKGRTMYRFDEYVGKIKSSVAHLYEVLREGREVHYTRLDFGLEAAEICVRQLEVKACLPSEYRLQASDVVEEEFHFTPLGSEKYSIGIGNRGFSSFITHWSSNFELIRHQLESVAYRKDAKIELNFDDSDTVLTIEHCRILDNINSDESGYRFAYKDYAKITIEPNGFVFKPIIVGYTNYQKTVQTLYEGLLKMALLHSEQGYDHDTPSRIEAYNMYKSPLIEKFLCGQTRDRTHSMTRQVRIKKIVTICPDYDYSSEDECHRCIDIDALTDKQGTPIIIPELEEWQREIRGLIVAVNVGGKYPFDWADYHKRGIELAKKLKERLATEYDLWYEAPAEDMSGTLKERILIL